MWLIVQISEAILPHATTVKRDILLSIIPASYKQSTKSHVLLDKVPSMGFVQSLTSSVSSTTKITRACSAPKDIATLEAAALRLSAGHDNPHQLATV
jgi:hypothetical protein